MRGRSGRQGDPGESKFYLSLEDDLMRLFGSERIAGIVERLGLEEDMPINASILSNSIESAQKRIEDNNFKRRRDVITYDDVMNQQRAIIYRQRGEVLNGENVSDTIVSMINGTIEETVQRFTVGDDSFDWDLNGLKNHYMGLITEEDDFNYSEDELKKLKKASIAEMLTERALDKYKEKEEMFGEETFREVERSILLRNVDKRWMDHIDAMDNLKSEIGLQAYAQRNPINEYRILGAEMFDEMISEIREGTVRMILSIIPREKAIERVQVARALSEGFSGQRRRKVTVAPQQKPKGITVSGKEKIGRNEPCPCGSGKKYKNCCGANPGASN